MFKLPYAVPDERDSFFQRLKKRLFYRTVPPFPRTVQIQTITGCTSNCVFCPHGKTYPSQPKGRMDDELFKKIIDECSRYRVRRISPYLMNESLIDREIAEKVTYIKEKIPRCKVVITTNASLLGRGRAFELLDTGALHALYISFQGSEKSGYERSMKGLDFEKNLANVEYLVDEIKRRGLKRPRVVLTMVETSYIDAPKAVEFWRKKDVEAKYTPFENRGGNTDEKLKHRMKHFSSCTRLFKQAFILFDGKVTLCCTDYTRSVILGDLRKNSLHEIWNSPKAVNIRKLFLDGKIDKIPLCRDCKISE